jgi:hypothetical protein
MNLVIENERVVVYDDVLPMKELVALREFLGGAKYTTPMLAGGYSTAWRPSDGQPLCSSPFHMSDAPFGSPLDQLVGPANEAAARHPNVIRPYDDVLIRTYVYARGMKLSWHTDGCAGAFTFFAHPRWSATWGGEAFIAEAPPLKEYHRDKSLEREWPKPEWEDDYVAGRGVGIWIQPKPNRIVLTSQTAYHSVNRIDDDAGEHVRVSITGFYVRKHPT